MGGGLPPDDPESFEQELKQTISPKAKTGTNIYLKRMLSDFLNGI